jgi:hypothetical protein
MKIKMVYRFGVSLGIIGLVALGATRAHSSQAAPSTGQALSYHNPVFSRDFPDPMVLRVNAHSYYAYGTTADWSPGAFLFFTQPTWCTGSECPPSLNAIPSGPVGTCGRPTWSTWARRITRITPDWARTGTASPWPPLPPRWPVQTARRRCLQRSVRQGLYRSGPFIDTNGKAYLYFSVDGPQHNISVLAMKSRSLNELASVTNCLASRSPGNMGRTSRPSRAPLPFDRALPTTCSSPAIAGTATMPWGTPPVHLPWGRLPHMRVIRFSRETTKFTALVAARWCKVRMAGFTWSTTAGLVLKGTTMVASATCESILWYGMGQSLDNRHRAIGYAG